MLITKNHLDRFQSSNEELLLTQIKNLAYKYVNEGKDDDSITVFLSHKHGEEEILKKVVKLMNGLGVTVYLDWEDEDMPIETSGKTAMKIKEKIVSNKKFILLATDDAINSKWCNWELGYGDSIKYLEHIAIMPIVDNDGSWPGNEYLQIYPVIKTEYNFSIGSYYVEFNNKRTKLEEWLKK